MLAYSIGYAVLFLASYVVGYPILTRSLGRRFLDNTDAAFISVWTGVVLISNALLLVSLLFPLSISTGLVVVVSLVGTSLMFSDRPRLLDDVKALLSPSFLVAFAVLLLAVSAYVVRPIILWQDTGIAHAGMIRWLNEYGSVRGVAIILGHFGPASSWFALAAPLNSAAWGTVFATFTGGFALFVFVLSVTAAATRALTGRARLIDWFLIVSFLIVMPFLLRTSLAISSSPDVPVVMLTIVLFSLFVAASSDATDAPNESRVSIDYRVLLVILGAGVASFKLSGMATAAGVLLYAIVTSRGAFLRRCLFYGGLVALMMLPTLLTSFQYSGCFLFPNDASCFDVPWRVNGAAIAASARLFAQTSGGVAVVDDWFFVWCARNAVFLFLLVGSILSGLHALASTILLRRILAATILLISGLFCLGLLTRTVSGFWQPVEIAMIPIGTVCLSSLLGCSARGTAPGPKAKGPVAGMVLISLASLAFIFWQAPSIRFGLGNSAVLPAFFASSTLIAFSGRHRVEESFPKLARLGDRPLVVVATVFLVVFSAGRAYKSTTEKSLSVAARSGQLDLPKSPYAPLLWPYRMLRYTGLRETVRTTVLEKRLNASKTFSYYFADAADCWDAPLPCTNWDISHAELRNPSVGIGAGFVQY